MNHRIFVPKSFEVRRLRQKEKTRHSRKEGKTSGKYKGDGVLTSFKKRGLIELRGRGKSIVVVRRRDRHEGRGEVWKIAAPNGAEDAGGVGFQTPQGRSWRPCESLTRTLDRLFLVSYWFELSP